MSNVTVALERLDLGLAESDVVLRLGEHFQRLEADRATLRLEVGRVQDENDWLREELAETQVGGANVWAGYLGMKSPRMT